MCIICSGENIDNYYELNIRCNTLEVLPPLPDTVSVLYIYRCKNLREITSFPIGLTKLFISHTPKLLFLPHFPDILFNLQICECNFNSLPPFPPALIQLCIFRTRITSLPPLPATVFSAQLLHNWLLEAPEKEDCIIFTDCRYIKSLHNIKYNVNIGKIYRLQKWLRNIFWKRSFMKASLLKKYFPKVLSGYILTF